MSRPDPAQAGRAAATAAGRDATEHRALVLAIPDLAAQLRRPPLDYASPEQWSGYIPPRMAATGSGHTRNDSPQRVHLIAIVAEAYRRTTGYGHDIAKAWLEDINTDRWTPTRSTSVYDAMHRAADVLDRNTPAWAKDERRDAAWTPHRLIEGN